MREDHQREGVGRLQMEALIEGAAAVGIQDVFVLADNEDEHALAFYDAIAGQPARRRAVENGMAADRCLSYGLHALLLRPMLGAESCAAVYAVVEPVIPFASLGEVS